MLFRSLGFGPKLLGRKIGETEYLISSIPLGGYVKMLGEEPGENLTEREKKRAFQFQPLFRRALIVFAGPVFNVLLTYMIYTILLSVQIPINIPVIDALMPVVDEVVQGGPAAKAGLKDGDRIVKIDGKNIDTWFDIVKNVREKPGEAINVSVKRGDKIYEYRVVTEAVTEKGGKGDITVGRIGVMKQNANFFTSIESKSIPDAFYKGAVATGRMGFFIFDSMRVLIKGDISLKNIGGPLTIVQESGRAASAGLLPYLMFMAIISVNLGILNLLPIPVLDGGHLMLFMFEGIKGGPLNEKTVQIAQRVGLALLIALMVVAFYNDIMRIFISK